ncbi:MAG: class I SAM-dependent methyltransferase [Rhodospirillales bacterium]|nr:class I SAM-dependent methyltransferase [Rhodospirillales bacterium]MBO6787685.1 class I SAM-dependent methyltransferase [Rhodospirillales bacterium]
MTDDTLGDHPHLYEGRELEAASNLVNYYRWITDLFSPYLKGSGTEIGAGVGTYSAYLRPFFSSMDLVEPSPRQLPDLTAKFGDDPDVRLFSETIEAYRAKVGDASRDCFCLVNVLEHIENDVAALDDMTAMLKPGGHVCVFVPALPMLYSKLDEILGHFRRYTKPELDGKFENAGLEIVKTAYMDVLGVPAWGLINTLLGSKTLNPKMAAIYDAACVPVTRAVESVVPVPFGKSLLIVGKKRG